MIDTEYSRRLDSLGRLVIPKKLRDKYGVESEKEYTFYFHEHEGKNYLCIEVNSVDAEIQKAKELLEKAGFEVGSRTSA